MIDFKKLRSQLGYTQARLAEVAKCSQSLVSRVEKGSATFSPEHVRNLRAELGNDDFRLTSENELSEASRFLVECSNRAIAASDLVQRFQAECRSVLAEVSAKLEQVSARSGASGKPPTRDQQSKLGNADEEARLRDEAAIARRERDAALAFAARQNDLLSEIGIIARRAEDACRVGSAQLDLADIPRTRLSYDGIDEAAVVCLIEVLKNPARRDALMALAAVSEDDVGLMAALAKKLASNTRKMSEAHDAKEVA